MFSANLILSFLLLVVRIYSKGLEEENVNDFDFVDGNTDGSISREELDKWYTKNFNIDPGVAPSSLFARFDSNHDGILSVPEFVPLVFSLGNTHRSKQSNKAIDGTETIFKQFDKNSDGVLTAEELESSKNDQKTVLPEILASLFQVADSNIDGKINPEEFKTIVHSLDSTESIPQELKNENVAQLIVTTIDKDKDKLIKDELWQFGNQFNQISKSEIDSIFDQLDINKDAKLSIIEVKRVPDFLQKTVGIQSMKAA